MIDEYNNKVVLVSLHCVNRFDIIVSAFICVCSAMLAIYLILSSPFDSGFLLRCPTKWILNGMNCPGCGTLRMFYSLMHGEFSKALSYNPAAFMLLPVMIWFLVDNCFKTIRGKGIKGITITTTGSRLILIGVVAYWAVRNI